MIQLKGTYVELSGMPSPYSSHETSKPHVNRVRKAMLMQIEEMSKNPKWIAFIQSQNGKDIDL